MALATISSNAATKTSMAEDYSPPNSVEERLSLLNREIKARETQANPGVFNSPDSFYLSGATWLNGGGGGFRNNTWRDYRWRDYGWRDVGWRDGWRDGGRFANWRNW